jgi:hypothetical protein
VATTAGIDVERGTDEVFAYVTDPRRFREWQDGVVGGHLDSDRPPAVGDRCRSTRRIGWAERTSTSEVTVVDRPRRWDIRGLDGPIRADVRVDVEPVGDGEAPGGRDRSRVTITIDFHGHGVGRILVPLLVRPRAGREMAANMRNLKRRLEAGADGPPG